MRISIPYGRNFLKAEVPNLIATLEPPYVKQLDDPNAVLMDKLENPIGSPSLRSLAENKKDAVIVINDITRPCHSEILVPGIVKVLNEAGISDERIKLLVATGNHRGNTREELEGMIGSDIVNRIEIYNHDAMDKKSMVYLGTTKRGIPVYINKIFVEASLKILTGIVSPHHSAGFGGGRKSVLPGIAGIDSIRPHHSFPIRPFEPSMGWIDGNPMHEESLSAAKMAKVDFIVNVVNNIEEKIAGIFAGDLDQAHRAGVDMCNKVHRVKVPRKADVVITSPGGFPRDFDLHQSQKAVVPAEMCCKKGGVIILVAEASDGIGKFGNWLKSAKEPKDVIDRFKKEGFTPESSSKALYYARALSNFKVIVVTKVISDKDLKEMFFTPIPDIQQAIEESMKIMGQDAEFIFIPHGSDIIPELES
ncbi:MAG: lactate racemase [Synergistaceae bacterium]|nr:lactate racemase [Synergistaceae bacterium]